MFSGLNLTQVKGEFILTDCRASRHHLRTDLLRLSVCNHISGGLLRAKLLINCLYWRRKEENALPVGLALLCVASRW